MTALTYTAIRRLIPAHNSIELVSNGGFGSDTVWIQGTGWSISAGTAGHPPIGAGDIEQDIIVTQNLVYEVKFTILSFSGGTLTPKVAGTLGAVRSANGDYVESITAGAGTSPRLEFSADSVFNGNLDDVSVKLGLNNYSLETDAWIIAPTDDSISNESVSLSGDVTETLFINRWETWRIQTDHIQDAELPNWREFLASTAGGETFTLDPYGSIAAPDDPVSVYRPKRSRASITRVGASRLWQITFQARVI